MSSTLIIQSHRHPLPYVWIQRCLDSVRQWSKDRAYDYQFMGDELFDSIPQELRDKTVQHIVVASDLARLYALRNGLAQGYDTVVWMDADFLVFHPEKFEIVEDRYAVGREVWVQQDERNKVKVYKKVHNAFLMFRRGNTFLEFYIEAAERLLSLNRGGMPPQFIGPKLLTALHNVAILPVQETAGMLSPLVIRDIALGEVNALQAFVKQSPQKVLAANLCISSCTRNEISESDMNIAVQRLLTSDCFL